MRKDWHPSVAWRWNGCRWLVQGCACWRSGATTVYPFGRSIGHPYLMHSMLILQEGICGLGFVQMAACSSFSSKEQTTFDFKRSCDGGGPAFSPQHRNLHTGHLRSICPCSLCVTVGAEEHCCNYSSECDLGAGACRFFSSLKREHY